MSQPSNRRQGQGRKLRRLALWALGLGLGGAAGCTWSELSLAPPPSPPPPAETLVLRGDNLEQEEPPARDSLEAELAGARELFRQRRYDSAATVFKRISGDKRASETQASEALFYAAECYRLEGRYPRAADTYAKLLKVAPTNPYREQCLNHMFEIANYWLDDTRKQLKQEEEKRQGKRYLVEPNFVHFEKTKPLTDEEGRAVQLLEQVAYNDPAGTYGLADKALFLAGSVKFCNEDYKEADYYFSQIFERHSNSPMAAKAVELAIVSKHLSTGGPHYDGRKVAEARVMIDSALRNYPELAQDPEKEKMLTRQLYSVTMQQAAKDFEMAEFYRRTGHPGSAYFYYELVIRRYPKTEYARLAARKKTEIEAKMQKKGSPNRSTVDPGTPPTPAEPEGTPAPAPDLGARPLNPPPGPGPS